MKRWLCISIWLCQCITTICVCPLCISRRLLLSVLCVSFQSQSLSSIPISYYIFAIQVPYVVPTAFTKNAIFFLGFRLSSAVVRLILICSLNIHEIRNIFKMCKCTSEMSRFDFGKFHHFCLAQNMQRINAWLFFINISYLARQKSYAYDIFVENCSLHWVESRLKLRLK